MKLDTTSKQKVSFASAVVALVFASCAGNTEKESQSPATTAAHSTAPTPAPAQSKPGGSGAASSTTAPENPAPAANAAQGRPLTAGGVASKVPTEWIVEQPTSAMRKAQLRLPKTGADTEDASLVVFFFGGQGGTPQANLDRWAGQFEQPDGKSSSEAMQSSQRTVAGMKVHDADLAGIYVAETTPGSGQRVRKEGWRMLASIVDAPSGAHYVKLVGPTATIAHWEPAYRRFISEMTPAQ
ncbi:MAG: hypothetical protein ACKVWV_06615 [Planctomycetota bacterium]